VAYQRRFIALFAGSEIYDRYSLRRARLKSPDCQIVTLCTPVNKRPMVYWAIGRWGTHWALKGWQLMGLKRNEYLRWRVLEKARMIKILLM
jgi:hypothetical protein